MSEPEGGKGRNDRELIAHVLHRTREVAALSREAARRTSDQDVCAALLRLSAANLEQARELEALDFDWEARESVSRQITELFESSWD